LAFQPYLTGSSHPTTVDAAAFAQLEGAGALVVFDAAPAAGGYSYPCGWDDGCAAAAAGAAAVGGAPLAARFPAVSRWLRLVAAAGPWVRARWPAPAPL